MRIGRRMLCIAILGASACSRADGEPAAIESAASTAPTELSDTAESAAPLPQADGWEELPQGPWSGRLFGSTFAVIGNDVLAWGPEGWAVIDVANQRLRTPTAPPIGARVDAASVWTGTELVVWGGYEQTGVALEYPPRGGAYNPLTDTWRTIATGPIESRTPAVVAWDGREMFVWGGWRDDGAPSTTSAVTGSSRRQLSDAAAYDPATDTWRQLTSVPPPGHIESTQIAQGTPPLLWLDVPDQSVPIYGSSNVLYAYDRVSDAWTTQPKSPLAGWSPASATGNEMFVALGQTLTSDGTDVGLQSQSWSAASGWQPLPRPSLDTAWVCQTQVLASGSDIVARRCTAVSLLRDGQWIELQRTTNSARLVVTDDWLVSIDTGSIERFHIP